MRDLRHGLGPRKPTRPAYSEGENEPGRLVEQEPTEVEREAPETGNQPVEREDPDGEEPPLFEE